MDDTGISSASFVLRGGAYPAGGLLPLLDTTFELVAADAEPSSRAWTARLEEKSELVETGTCTWFVVVRVEPVRTITTYGIASRS